MKTIQSLLSRALTAAMYLSFLPSAFSRAQAVVDNLWVTNGTVNATAFSGNTIYIGGTFTYVGPSTGSFVAIDSSTGTRDASFPKVAGSVFAIVSDGSGGWFIGGTFTAVDRKSVV